MMCDEDVLKYVDPFFSDDMIPMIPLGLKETKEIDFREPFRDFVLEHYSEEPEEYDDAVAEFMDVRQVT